VTWKVPKNDVELLECLRDPMWRICSGHLYKILGKGGLGVIPFIPNEAQLNLLENLWHRNLVLKARQRGFTTLICILWLDHALFNKDQRCGVIAHDRESAEVILRDKVMLAYENLPELLRSGMPLKKDSASELMFSHNNSSIRVATSMRSGTIDRLHISEFGKICSKYPDKAREIVRGSLPAVPTNGILVVESTAEGRDGDYYAMVCMARELQEKRIDLTERDYRFHFYSWVGDKTYEIDPELVSITGADHEYFDGVESRTGEQINMRQRAWYVKTRESDFGNSSESMWQEYPSEPDEAFAVSTEGTYYAQQLTDARKDGRIGRIPHRTGLPVDTYWDIGSSDGTAIWLSQRDGKSYNFIGFIEGWGEPYSYYVDKLQKLGYVWGNHYLPHDAAHKRQQGLTVASPIDMVRKLGIAGSWKIVPVVSEITHGIQLTRNAFSSCYFDEVKCKEGLIHLSLYRKTWNDRAGCWSDSPRHDIHSEAADAFRQFAQSLEMEEESTVSKFFKAIPVVNRW